MIKIDFSSIKPENINLKTIKKEHMQGEEIKESSKRKKGTQNKFSSKSQL